jgi:hypothetical protein
MSHDAPVATMSNKRVRDDGAFVSLSRPDLEAYRISLIVPMPDLLSILRSKIGRKLAAYVASVDDVKTIQSWIAGEPSPKDAERRLRLTYQIVITLTIADTSRVAQAWLIGRNPDLADRVPLRLAREGNLVYVARHIVGAERAFCRSWMKKA